MKSAHKNLDIFASVGRPRDRRRGYGPAGITFRPSPTSLPNVAKLARWLWRVKRGKAGRRQSSGMQTQLRTCAVPGRLQARLAGG